MQDLPHPVRPHRPSAVPNHILTRGWVRRLPQDHADGTCADCARRIEKEQRRAAESTTGPSSAKIRKVMELLRQIQARGEGDEKTIVFSQFTSWFNIAEAFLVEEGIRFTRRE